MTSHTLPRLIIKCFAREKSLHNIAKRTLCTFVNCLMRNDNEAYYLQLLSAVLETLLKPFYPSTVNNTRVTKHENSCRHMQEPMIKYLFIWSCTLGFKVLHRFILLRLLYLEITT